MRGFEDNGTEARRDPTADIIERLDTLIAIGDKLIKALTGEGDKPDDTDDTDKGGTEE